MRRTFQDLARAAEVKDIVTRAISGHATETMQHHYSTVAAEEKKLAIAKVIELAGVRKALPEGPPAPGDMHGGMHDPEGKKKPLGTERRRPCFLGVSSQAREVSNLRPLPCQGKTSPVSRSYGPFHEEPRRSKTSRKQPPRRFAHVQLVTRRRAPRDSKVDSIHGQHDSPS